jgi:hypothetical protein
MNWVTSSADAEDSHVMILLHSIVTIDETTDPPNRGQITGIY